MPPEAPLTPMRLEDGDRPDSAISPFVAKCLPRVGQRRPYPGNGSPAESGHERTSDVVACFIPSCRPASPSSMFFHRKRIDTKPPLRLFRITCHVGRGSNTEMPANLRGAYVPVFIGATDHEGAARLAIAGLRDRGFEFLDIADGKIDELDPIKWDSFIASAWPDFLDYFPSQEAVLKGLASEFYFTGPFASYEAR